MTTTTERARPRSRPKALTPSIREVCLVGTPGRRYVHIAPEGLRARDRGPGSKPAVAREM